MTNATEYLRFRWSHDHIIHRSLVRLFNGAMSFVPFSAKYSIGMFLRTRRSPYNLVTPGSTVVQIGAPADTLLAGRSRAVYFCLAAGEQGKVVIVEPDEKNINIFKSIAGKQRMDNAILVQSAVWSEHRTLEILINPSHPASNFIRGTKTIDRLNLTEFHLKSIPANTLDNILDANHIQRVDLVSITTNGSEPEILKGMVQSISRGITYICLARTSNYIEFMKSIGYELYAYDDRGYTFRQFKMLNPDDIRMLLQ